MRGGGIGEHQARNRRSLLCIIYTSLLLPMVVDMRPFTRVSWAH